MSDIFNIIIAIVALRGDVDAYMAEVSIGREPFVSKEPEGSFDFIRGISFPDSGEDGMLQLRLVALDCFPY